MPEETKTSSQIPKLSTPTLKEEELNSKDKNKLS